MKYLISRFLVLLCFGTLVASGQSREDSARAMMQTLKLVNHTEDLRIEAMVANDLALLDSVLSEDLTYVHTDGKIETKQEFLKRLESGDLRSKSMERDQLKTRLYGNTAVITGRARVRVEVKGEERRFQIRFMDVYVLRDDRWQMIAWQSTRLPEQ